MSFLGKFRKADLILAANELGIEVPAQAKIVDIKELIKKSPHFEEEFVHDILKNIVEEERRKEEAEEIKRKEEMEERIRKQQMEFELEKMRLESASNFSGATANKVTTPKGDIQSLIPKFESEDGEITLFFVLFERQMKFLEIPENMWVTHLINSVPRDVARLIARENEEDFQNFSYIKDLLLKRYKLNAEKFRQLFSQHRKSSSSSWRDYYYELKTYWEGWLAELNITTFSELQDLMITDQIKKRCPSDIKDHFLDEWATLKSPKDLAEKLDSYDRNRAVMGKKESNFRHPAPKRDFRKSFEPEKSKTPQITKDKLNLSCYGCGKVGYIKAKCPNCNPAMKSNFANFGLIHTNNCENSPGQMTFLKIFIKGLCGVACADTGATRSIASDTLYEILKSKGVQFRGETLTMCLADGQKNVVDALVTKIVVTIEGRAVPIDIIALPEVKGNRTLLGMDFLSKAGIVLDIRNRKWHFQDNFRRKFPFSEDIVNPDNTSSGQNAKEIVANSVERCSDKSLYQKINDELPCKDPYQNITNPVDEPASLQLNEVEINVCTLRSDEGQHLTNEEKQKMNLLLEEYEDIFRLGGEATPYIEHHIDTGDHSPVAVPPYRVSPARKIEMQKEIERLLSEGIIEECESPYAAPVVLIPKPNGTFRFCVDYRKLNAITKTDSYPLPRMDDLLHAAKSTAYMSTIDLKAGYHQVNVAPGDRDKTAFTCPFGTFRFIRMPFGLKGAPATFQRLIDRFRNGLKNVTVLSYLDDIIVLSETFEDHIHDLSTVFQRLEQFKLQANREKCNFACSKVKYLGHWITPHGIEVDPGKVEAITKFPVPKNEKQVKSFLQTCSWYRRFIENFSDISRPLSELTKKKTVWKWSEVEQSAFNILKEKLTSSPILKQADPTKPYVIRTDASSYGLGAILLQGEGPNEHPIEYASRLLTSAERNYSTTEREALAVIWSLKKFQGYIDGAEVTIASDHQPLKWLLSLKSPSGRLARWALQLQSYNLKMQYIPGKSNVIADMLSRPPCAHEENSCSLCAVAIDFPTVSSADLRSQQLQDPELKKIIDCFEDNERANDAITWTDRGYIMNQGILYKYAPESETDEAQWVVPVQERKRILEQYHDAPTACHYGVEGTYHRINKKYFWVGMKKFIADYIKNCQECSRYKASNQKPAGLLQTPVMSQRFETLSIDLFGPLPEDKDGMKWIFIVEDPTTKWVELFAMRKADAKSCALTLLNEIFLRYGLPRRLISDNGVQFVSNVMQQLCFLLQIDQCLTPVYHPQANPVERKNRDLKPRLAILVGNDHSSWVEKLPSIRFAMNTSRCETTGQTASYLQFGRELRTPDSLTHDLRSIINNDNFIPEITPHLKRFAKIMHEIKERSETLQDRRKVYADKLRRRSPNYAIGDKVWVSTHPLSNAKQGRIAKFNPRRDGPYVIISQRSPTTFEIANPDSPEIPLGVYHSSALKLCESSASSPVNPLKKRGRPRKTVPDTGRFVRNRGGV